MTGPRASDRCVDAPELLPDDAIHRALEGAVVLQQSTALAGQARAALRALAGPALEEPEAGGGLELANVDARASVRHAHPGNRLLDRAELVDQLEQPSPAVAELGAGAEADSQTFAIWVRGRWRPRDRRAWCAGRRSGVYRRTPEPPTHAPPEYKRRFGYNAGRRDVPSPAATLRRACGADGARDPHPAPADPGGSCAPAGRRGAGHRTGRGPDPARHPAATSISLERARRSGPFRSSRFLVGFRRRCLVLIRPAQGGRVRRFDLVLPDNRRGVPPRAGRARTGRQAGGRRDGSPAAAQERHASHRLRGRPDRRQPAPAPRPRQRVRPPDRRRGHRPSARA